MTQGRRCAERPGQALAVCAVAVLLTALGLLRLRVETDPQRLWVGSDSQALAEKRHFEVCWLQSRLTASEGEECASCSRWHH
jgi:hypothetical protein